MNMKYPNIDAERARRSMSVDALTKAIGVSRKTYYNWVNKGKIPRDKLQLIADIFDCSADYLLGRA